MKKLVSLGIVSAMVATMAAPTFAVKPASGNINDIHVFVFSDDANNNLKTATELTPQKITFQGLNYDRAVNITATNSNKYNIVFGLSNECPFGTGTSAVAPSNLQVLKAANSKSVVKGGNELSGTTGVEITTQSIKINTVHGEYTKAQGIVIKGRNSTPLERYSVYPITLKDINNNTTTIRLCITAPGFDKDDTSDAEGTVSDEGKYIDYADGKPLNDGYTIGYKTLLEMFKNHGQYRFVGAKGVDVLSSVSKATVEAGQTSFKASAYTDVNLDARYNANQDGKIFRVSVGMFPDENRMINIKFDNKHIYDLLSADFCDKILEGSIKKLYVYPINAEGYESLANASGNDGLIDTDKVIVAKIQDGKAIFSLTKGITEVMISQKEIDTTKLAAIPGVSVPETTTNEITAPVIDITSGTATTSEVVAPVATATAPTVVSSPVLSSVPAGSGAAQNTGASDVIAVSIALAAISMAAAGVVASKKF